MKKVYLLKYSYPKFFVLANWIDYELLIEIVWFWGLFKHQKTILYRVYDYQNIALFFDKWDKLITEKLPLN